MISQDKLRANRTNASASTGPRTLVGKAKSGQNAWRHGLSLPTLVDRSLLAAIEALAREIAGTDTGLERLEPARQIAETQADLARIRRVRTALVADLLSILAPPERTSDAPTGRQTGDQFTPRALHLVSQLAALERYERRAFSRRKFAIRMLETYPRSPPAPHRP